MMSIQLKPFSWDRMIEAVEAVRQRARRATAALAQANIPYAVVGGNAVAAWVARADRAAVRNTQDVDILIQRSDFDRVRVALDQAGFVFRTILGIDCFLDSENANPRDAVQLLYADEKVRPSDLAPAASLSETEPSDEYTILTLESLVRMKLTSFRLKDQVHLQDMISVKLIDESWPAKFAPELAVRLQQIIDDPER
jgi:Uncharacterised nucleotidyltransferase